MGTKSFSNKKKYQSISGRKKTISLLFILSFIFVVGGFVALAAGETTANPNVSGSGVGADGQMLPGVSSGNSMSKNTEGLNPTGGGGQVTSKYINPIKPETVEQVLTSVMGYLRGIAGTIAVIFIIIGGIMYMISGGSDMTETAKKTVIYALVGLAIVIAAPLFYQEIKAILSGGSPGSALHQILFNTLRLLLSIVGFLAIITMVVGAIWMFTAVGDEDKYELGKKTATYSIIGLAIAVGSLILADQVVKLIGGR